MRKFNQDEILWEIHPLELLDEKILLLKIFQAIPSYEMENEKKNHYRALNNDI